MLSLRGQISILTHADRDGCITHQVLCNVLAEALLLRIQQQEQMRRVEGKMKEAHERNFNALVAAGSQSASVQTTPDASASRRMKGNAWGGSSSAISSGRELTQEDPAKATLPPVATPTDTPEASHEHRPKRRVSTSPSPPTSPAQKHPPSKQAPSRSEYATLDVLDSIPAMLTNEGAFLNVFFTSGVEGYEYTNVVELMDACGVRLVHGWLIDPQDTQLAKEVGNESYNGLTSKVAGALSVIEERERKEAAAEEHEMGESKADNDDLTTYPFFQHFLEQYPTQLTTAGLFALHDSVHDGELCVLFRNDHFSVLTKKKRILLTLVTDEDLAAKLESSGGNVAWETLEDVNGEASRFAAAEVVAPKRRHQGEPTAQRAMVPVRGSIVTGSSNNANVQQGVVVPSRAMGVNNSHQHVRRVDPYASPAPTTRTKSKTGDGSGCTIM